MSILGPTPFGLRFPSMVEFYAGSMVTLLYVKRKAGIAFAALAVLMLWAAGPPLYCAVEALHGPHPISGLRFPPQRLSE
jgi:hypothetical protein